MLKALNRTICVIFLVCGMFVTHFSQATIALQAQRNIYQQFIGSLKQTSLPQGRLKLLALTEYPLARYAEYRLLLTHSDSVSVDDVVSFIKNEPESAVNSSFLAHFVEKWHDTKQWDSLFSLSQKIELSTYLSTTAQTCAVLNAQLSRDFSPSLKQVEKVWLTGNNLPNSCDKVIEFYLAHSPKDEALMSRIALSLEANNPKLALYLIKQLSSSAQQEVKALKHWLEAPNDLTPFLTVKPSLENQTYALLAFEQLAKSHLSKALSQKSALIDKLSLSSLQQQRINDALLRQLLYLNAPTDQQMILREKLFKQTSNDELIAYRLRIALRENDWGTLEQGLTRLSTETQKEDVWRYWSARVLMRKGEDLKAESILNQLMQARGFYPMIAAQTLGKIYQFSSPTILEMPVSTSHQKVLSRISEFLYWGQSGPARREWQFLLSKSNENEHISLAKWAIANQFADLAVSATISGKLWDHIALRFPVAYLDTFTQETGDNQVSLSYALAIARQESAWIFDIISPVGAKGLMQVMPATAKQVATKHQLEEYRTDNDLLEPTKNIAIGVRYLNDRLLEFNNNRIFATAAYNAGPSRIDFWLKRTQGKVDAVQFIESISFPETRQYVKNVLAFDYYYREILKAEGIEIADEPFILTDEEWDKKY